MKRITFCILLVILSFACADEDLEKQPLTYEDFSTSLKREMDYNNIIKLFGEPAKDIGSGIHIYVYQLSDGTEILIGYAGGYIHYATHVDKNQQLLHTII